MGRRKISVWKYCLLFLCPVGYCLGQDSLSTGDDTAAFWNLSMDEVVVTAQYAPTHYTNAVHKVKVIDGKKIEKLGLSNLSEVLNTRINMQVSTDLQLGNGLKIRGIGGENVQIMIDGVPVIGRLDGNIDLSQIQVNNIRRIEIIEGTMSSLYGSNASGGVINVITEQSQVPRFKISGQNRAESAGILENSLSAGWRAGGFLFQGNVRRYHSQLEKADSLRVMTREELPDGSVLRVKKNPWNPKLQWSADGSVVYRRNDSLEARYTYRYFDEEVMSYGEIRRPDFKPYAFDDRFDTKRSDHSVAAKGYLGDRWYFTATLGLNLYDRISSVSRKDFEENTISPVNGSADSTHFTSFLSRKTLSYSIPDLLDIQAGGEWYQESASGTRFEASETETSIRNTAGWLSLKYSLMEQLSLTGNLRYGYNTAFDHPWLPAVHLLWKPDPVWTMRAGYSRGFRAPSLKEILFEFIDVNHFILGNKDLAAESSSNFNFSLSAAFPVAGRSLKADTELFLNRIQNRIVLAEYEQAKYTYLNLEEFSTHGMEVSLEYDLTRHLTWHTGAGLTRLSNLYTDETHPEKYYSLWEWENTLEFLWPQWRTSFYATQKWTGRQTLYRLTSTSELAEGYIDGMNLINLSASRPFFEDRIHLNAGVKNLLDVRSVAIGGGGSASGAHSSAGSSQLVHWGRTFFLGLNFNFSYHKE